MPGGDLGPKSDPKRDLQVVQKSSKNYSEINPKNCLEKDPKMTPKWFSKSIPPNQIFEAFWGNILDLGQDGPRWPKTGPR